MSELNEIEKLLEGPQKDLQEFYGDVKRIISEKNRLVLKSVSELKGKSFKVDDYQRGYKWTSDQVSQLLEDIHKHEKSEVGFYCLQPVVVKRIDTDRGIVWEVIDGQQRLTTIFIILQTIHHKRGEAPYLKMDYQTRESSAEFLNKKFVEKYEKLNEWKQIIHDNSQFNNSDVYHFMTTLVTVEAFFKGMKESDKQDWIDKLANHTRVIWYEADVSGYGKEGKSKKASIDVFTRINNGKIPLEQSELIKAVLLNKLNEDFKHSSELAEIKKRELVMQWDAIEHRLQNEAFWSFLIPKVTNNDSKKAIRIDLLFEALFSNKNSKPFEPVQDRIPQDSVDVIWGEVVNAFNRFQEWFDNDRIFHLVGFLLTQGVTTISVLLGKANEQDRDSYEKYLVNEVKHSVKEKKKELTLNTIEELNYSETTDRSRIENLLVLFNIALHENIKTRFPFELRNKWTLEHIHAQNQKALSPETIRELYTFFIGEVSEELSEEQKLRDEFNKTFGVDVDADIHNIGNMALLERNLNSSIGNDLFAEKRKQVLEHKEYVPIGTQQVFSKSYSRQNVQMYVWTEDDQAAYIEKIKETIGQYLNIESKKAQHED